jgi:hypothetical protein
VAFTARPATFNNTLYHTLELTAVGTSLQVSLDGALQTFTQAGKSTTTVSIPPVWDGPPSVGVNAGGIGIAFGAEDNRNSIGGQRAKNFVVTTAKALQ